MIIETSYNGNMEINYWAVKKHGLTLVVTAEGTHLMGVFLFIKLIIKINLTNII